MDRVRDENLIERIRKESLDPTTIIERRGWSFSSLLAALATTSASRPSAGCHRDIREVLHAAIRKTKINHRLGGVQPAELGVWLGGGVGRQILLGVRIRFCISSPVTAHVGAARAFQSPFVCVERNPNAASVQRVNLRAERWPVQLVSHVAPESTWRRPRR